MHESLHDSAYETILPRPPSPDMEHVSGGGNDTESWLALNLGKLEGGPMCGGSRHHLTVTVSWKTEQTAHWGVEIYSTIRAAGPLLHKSSKKRFPPWVWLLGGSQLFFFFF